MKGSWGKQSINTVQPKAGNAPSPLVGRTLKFDKEEPALDDSELPKIPLEAFTSSVERLVDTSSALIHAGTLDVANDFSKALQEFPVLAGEHEKQLLQKLSKLLVRGEAKRGAVFSELSTGFAVPMKQFLRVDVTGLREMQDRVELARQTLDEAQLRYDIARSSNKKKSLVEKLSHELESTRTQHSLLKMNLASRMKEFEAKQRFDALQRLYGFLSDYGQMFEAMAQEYSKLKEEVKTTQAQLASLKEDWETKRSELNVSDVLENQMSEIEISRQGYVDLAQIGGGRYKKMWMVATQGILYLYQTWKDESPKSQIDLVLCSVKTDAEECVFQLTSPQEMYSVKCQTPDEAEQWMNVIRKSIQYKLKKLQEEKRRNDPNAAPDYLKELQMLSKENLLCSDCGGRLPEWASMTLGVVACDGCAGVHRALGTHVSRVRSLTIDMWTPEQYYVMKQFGNEFANKIWEHSMGNDKAAKRMGSLKPGPAASREERDAFIRAKYVEKRWLQPRPSGWREDANALAEKLYDFGSINDLKGMFLALAHGANPAVVMESGLNVLHQLVVDGKADVYTLQMLLLHSSDLHKRTAQGLDALQLAAQHNRPAYCKFLITQGFDPTARSAAGLTAREIAAAAPSREVLKFFETGELLLSNEPTHEALQEKVLEQINRIVGKLAASRAKLGEAQDPEKIFEIAKQIRMVKIGIQQLEKDGFID